MSLGSATCLPDSVTPTRRPPISPSRQSSRCSLAQIQNKETQRTTCSRRISEDVLRLASELCNDTHGFNDIGSLRALVSGVNEVTKSTASVDVQKLMAVLVRLCKNGSNEIKELSSDALFNLGTHRKPDVQYLEIWDRSLECNFTASTKLGIKCARYLLALSESPNVQSRGLCLALQSLYTSAQSQCRSDLTSPLWKQEPWPRISVAMNKLASRKNLAEIFGDCNLETLAISLRALLPYRPPKEQVISIFWRAQKIITGETDSHERESWILAERKLLGTGSLDQIRQVLETGGTCTRHKLEAISYLLIARQPIPQLYEIVNSLIKRDCGVANEPILGDLIKLLDLDIPSQCSDHLEFELEQILSQCQLTEISQLEKLSSNVAGSTNEVVSSLYTIAKSDLLILERRIALAMSLLQREAVILRGRMVTEPGARIGTSGCQYRLRLVSLYLETNIRLSYLASRAGDMNTTRLFLQEAHLTASKFGASGFVAKLTQLLACCSSGKLLPTDSELAPAVFRKSILLNPRLDNQAHMLMTSTESYLFEKANVIVSQAVSLIPEPQGYQFMLKSQSKAPQLKARHLFERSFEESLRADTPEFRADTIRAHSYSSICANLSLLGCKVDAGLIAAMLDYSRLAATESWRASHRVRHLARDPLSLPIKQQSRPSHSLQLNRLPYDICAICIDFVRPDEIMLTRVIEGSVELVVRLPLARMSSSCGVIVPELEDVLHKLEHQIQKVREHATSSMPASSGAPTRSLSVDSSLAESSTGEEIPSSSGSAVIDKDEQRRWWRRQLELDKELGKLLNVIETLWLGGFHALLDPDQNLDVTQDLLKDVRLALLSGIKQYLRQSCKTFNLDKLVLDSRLVALILACSSNLKRSLSVRTAAVEDLIIVILDQWQLQGLPVIYEDISFYELAGEVLTVAVRHAKLNRESGTNRRLVLIPDSRCMMIPWEALECMPKSTTRAFSLAHLVELTEQSQLERPRDNTTYMLNPDGQLARTQREFEPEFRLRNWDGWAGPTKLRTDMLALALENSHYFLYAGHNAGENFIRASIIRRLKSAPAALLMGCSSAVVSHQKPESRAIVPQYDVYGPILDWHAAGSPLIIGMLWDVPDKDLNRFTREFLSKFFDDGMSAGTATAAARKCCLLPHTTGAAPIVYGLL